MTQGQGALESNAIIKQLEIWRKEGSDARDTGAVNPHSANTLASYMHCEGWLRRDLQLCLARANPGYRKFQIACGNITEEGIRGGYGFECHTKFVEADALPEATGGAS